ncbi:MAG: tetratricopeptide repeat protein [Candidatus Hydrogenedentes bacterium]|nr:tetratricopeptide repeat protein [Candidatus Hydrogenedentota bacterium]
MAVVAEKKRWLLRGKAPAVAWVLLMASAVVLAVFGYWRRQAIEMALDNQSLHKLQSAAEAAVAAGDASRAEAAYAKLVDKYPSKEEALLSYAAFLEGMGAWDRADAMYARAVEQGPQRHNAVSSYAAFLDRNPQTMNEPERAIQMCRDYVTRYPEDTWANLELGKRLVWQGHHAACEPYLRAAAANPVLTVQALTMLGQAQFADKQFDRAIATWQEVLDAGSSLESRHVLYNLGQAHRALGQVDAAVQSYEQHLAHFPQSTWALSDLVSLYSEQGRSEAAVRAQLALEMYRPARVINKELVRFIQLQGVTPGKLAAAPGQALQFQLYFQFLDDFAPERLPDITFRLAAGDATDAIALDAMPPRIGPGPCWRGNVLIQPFALSIPSDLTVDGELSVVAGSTVVPLGLVQAVAREPSANAAAEPVP